MRFLDRMAVTVEPAADGHADVAIDGRTARVRGSWLEAAVACGDDDPVAGWLLFLTDDVPYEERLSITLLDRDLRPLDSAWLGGMYATGTWSEPAIEGPGRLRFRFIDAKVWRLALLPGPALRLPFGEPRGSHRPFGLMRHFVLSAG